LKISLLSLLLFVAPAEMRSDSSSEVGFASFSNFLTASASEENLQPYIPFAASKIKSPNHKDHFLDLNHVAWE
jgi:hypothetical protein